MANNNAINYNSATSLPVVQGGTGTNTLTVNGVLVGEGTSPVNILSAGTTGQLLVGVTSADPAFGSSANADFTFTTATAAATRKLTVSNTDNSSTSSNATLAISTANTSANPSSNFTVTGGFTWNVGIKNQSFSIQRSNGNQVTFSSTGVRNFTTQVAASIRKTANTSNATGDGTNATVTGYNATALFNNNGFWSGGASNIFGPQAAGKFLVIVQGSVSSTVAMTSGVTTIKSTGHIMLVNQCNVGATRNASNNFSGVRGSAVINMAAFDSVSFTIQFSGSTKTASVQGVNSTSVITYFSAVRIA